MTAKLLAKCLRLRQWQLANRNDRRQESNVYRLRAACTGLKAISLAHLTVYNCFGHLHDDGVTDGAYVQNSILGQQLQEVILHLQTNNPA